MGPIKEILAETQFQEELTSSSQTKLVIVDFTASWCGPCQTIAPFFEQLSRKYPNAVFLKVDVDKCQETAVNQRVSVMPTFHFYRNKVKVDSMQGADRQKLEEMIQKYYDDGTAEDVGVAGHIIPPEAPPSKKSIGSVKSRKDKKGEKEAKEEPELDNTRMVSTHHIGQEGAKRTSFKEGAQKFFAKLSNDEEGAKEFFERQNRKGDKDRESRQSKPKKEPEKRPEKRQSFKEVMGKIFHPQKKKEKETRTQSAGKEKKPSKTGGLSKDQSSPKEPSQTKGQSKTKKKKSSAGTASKK